MGALRVLDNAVGRKHRQDFQEKKEERVVETSRKKGQTRSTNKTIMEAEKVKDLPRKAVKRAT